MIAADRRRLTPVLAVICALLVALLIALWAGLGRGVRWDDAAAPPRLPPERAATPPPSVAPLQDYAVVWEKPLFSPDRKPIAVAASNGNANSGDLELTGVILLPDLHMALLREKNSGQTLRVREGGSADGVAVVEVKPRSAVVDANGTRSELELKVGPAPSATNAVDNAPAVQPTPFVAVPQTPPGNAQEDNTPQASEAWSKALKARIEERRREAARRQQQQQQNDGDQ